LNSLEHLIVDVKESLEREMHAGFQQITDRFDGQTVRFDRHGALLQTGSRWTTRMTGWSERIDASLERKDREIAELRERVSRLESKPPDGRSNPAA
jgi:hypothetical protein